jgi:hypothetical protein
MPNQISLLEALAAAAFTSALALTAAAIIAAAALLLFGAGRTKRTALAYVGTILSVGLGFFAGCAWIGVRPHWPPGEDQDRLLLILYPSAMIVELLAPAFKKWVWVPRFAVAASAAWILLYGSVYTEDLAGPGSREWTPGQTWLILTVFAAASATVWATLSKLARGSGGRTVPLAMALTCGGAGATVMLSGYASGGQLGFPLAGSIAGAVLASFVLAGSFDAVAASSLSVVGLFALLVIGRFFGELTTINAIALFLAPLLCWLPELPLVRRLEMGQRNFVRLVLAVVPVIIVLSLAQQKFKETAAGPSTSSQEGSIDDYRNYGR